MYENPEEFAFPFQLYVLITMIQHHTAPIARNRIKVMERSIFSSKYCFFKAMTEMNIMKPPITDVLTKYYEYFEKDVNITPKLVIYLKTNPERVIERIKVREREAEQNVDTRYLRLIHQLHEAWIDTLIQQNISVLTVNADENLKMEDLITIANAIKRLECENIVSIG